MPQKRKAKPLRRGSRKLKAARHEPGNFDLWLDGTLRLKESRSFHAFEAQLLEKYNCLDATVDDRATCAYELGLLYCQLGSFAQADKYLSELGFKYRLGKQIWLCQPTAKGSEGSLSEPFACFDNILPECFLSRLLVAFSSDSAFWAEHGYPTDRFFSYNTQLPGTASLCEETVKRKASARAPSDAAASGDNLMAQLAQYLMPLVAASFPAKAVEGIRSVEWWAHSRPNGPAAGHRFHYDLDESRLRSADGAAAVKDASIHPVVSSVLYLDDGGNSGAPTVLIDQRLSGGSSDRAWLCVPKTSRLLLFDGALLHGVAPHISNEPISSGARLTLMIGWWSPQVITMPHGLVLGPNMTMPQATATTLASWPALFRPLPTAIVTSLNDVRKNGLTKSALINIEKNVWEKVKTQERNPKETNDLQSVESNDILFVGNWFLKSRNDINDEIMQSLNITDSPKVESVMVSADVGWLSFEDLKKMRGDT